MDIYGEKEMMKKRIRKGLLGFALSVLVLLGVGGQMLFAASSDIVTIPEANLKAALNTTLGQGAGSDITEGQMASITNLYLNNSSIADLTGLQYGTGITYFSMTANQVTNLDSIKAMNSLVSLTLSGNNITSSNFPDLSYLTSLTKVDLSNSGVDNAVLDKVNKITTLTSVRFQSNSSITIIEPLVVLSNLTEIWVQFCGVSDFRPINNMPSLTAMYGSGQNTGLLDPPTTLDKTGLDL